LIPKALFSRSSAGPTSRAVCSSSNSLAGHLGS
jgi:hypothetical protein